MSTTGASEQKKPSASYLRSLPVEQAVAARKLITIFFGTAQPSIAHIPRMEKSAFNPAGARWVLYGGIVLLIASLLSYIFRDWLPPSTPGFYLGAGGLAVIAAGVAYWWFMRSEAAEKPVTPEKPKDSGREAVERQIRHVTDNAVTLFGAVPEGGQRAVLQGIGRKEWNNDHDIPVREIENDRIFASVVHLLIVDLTPQFVAVRELGLDLTTGTICEESAIRRPVSEVLSATRRAQHIAATGEWDRAEQLAEKLAALQKANPRTADKNRLRATALQAEMQRLSFDDTTGDEFTLRFTGNEKVVLTVADRDHARNLRKVAYPIGGAENLKAVIAAWEAINTARAAAEAARYEHRAVMQSNTVSTATGVVGVQHGITTAQQGLAGFQDAVLQGVNVMVQKLSNLEAAMQALAIPGAVAASSAMPGDSATASAAIAPGLAATGAAAAANAVAATSAAAKPVEGPSAVTGGARPLNGRGDQSPS